MSGHAPEVGTLGEEARRLVQALATWAESRPGPAHHVYTGEWDRTAPPPAGARPVSCGYCPVCQVITLARGERPEVVAKLVEAATAALGAVAMMVERDVPPTEQADEEPGPEPPRVQRIDVL